MKKFTRIEPTTRVIVGEQFKRDVIIKRFKTPDGLEHEFTTYGTEGQRSGGVIALTPDKKVITTYQFRAGPECWMYDIPGGGFYDHETIQEAATRELREETGYVPGKLEYLGESSCDAYTNITQHYFFATDCVLAGERKLDVEENEQGAEVKLISISDFIENAKSNRMTDPRAVLMAYDRLNALESAS